MFFIYNLLHLPEITSKINTSLNKFYVDRERQLWPDYIDQVVKTKQQQICILFSCLVNKPVSILNTLSNWIVAYLGVS